MLVEKIPERGWIPLYTLFKLGKIPTAVKLQKLIFLVQTEGHIGGYRFFKKHYGPYSDELNIDVRSFSQSLGLMQMKIIEGTTYPYYLYSATSAGNSFVKEVVMKKLPAEILKRAEEIIDCYKDKNYRELQEYVYRKYVITEETFGEVYPSIRDDLISLNALWEKLYSDDCPAAFLFLAVIEYCSKALSKLNVVTYDQVLRGVCVSSFSELTHKMLDISSSCETSNKCPFSFKTMFSEISDQINFINYYCGKHGIIDNILDIDFSDFMNEEELGRLEKEMAKTRPSELMY